MLRFSARYDAAVLFFIASPFFLAAPEGRRGPMASRGPCKSRRAVGLLEIPALDAVAKARLGLSNRPERIPEIERELFRPPSTKALRHRALDAADGFFKLPTKLEVPRCAGRLANQPVHFLLELVRELIRRELLDARNCHNGSIKQTTCQRVHALPSTSRSHRANSSIRMRTAGALPATRRVCRRAVLLRQFELLPALVPYGQRRSVPPSSATYFQRRARVRSLLAALFVDNWKSRLHFASGTFSNAANFCEALF